MTIEELHAELTAFADLLSSKIIEKFVAFQEENRRRDWASMQARSKAQLAQEKFRHDLSVQEAEAAREAERKKQARLELERTIDRSLLTPGEFSSFERGEDVPSDYAERVERKRLEREERELMRANVRLLTDEEADALYTRGDLPSDYRERALRDREEQRRRERLALVYDHQDLLSDEERMHFQSEGVIPPDFEARFEIAKKTGAPNAGAGVPKVRL